MLDTFPHLHCYFFLIYKKMEAERLCSPTVILMSVSELMQSVRDQVPKPENLKKGQNVHEDGVGDVILNRVEKGTWAGLGALVYTHSLVLLY